MEITMKEIILAILGSGVLSSIVSAIISTVQSRNQTREGLKQILYFQIKSDCKEAIKNGYIDDDSLEALHEAWATYHEDLKGNGYLDTLMKKVDSLPLR